MLYVGSLIAILAISNSGCICFLLNTNDEYQVWLTTGDMTKKLNREPSCMVTNNHHGYSVWVDRNKRRQTIDGFGAALSNSAAYVLFHSPNRHVIMRDLFGTDENQLGVSYLRLVMGASDLMAVDAYTYDDLANSRDTDFNMSHFTIQKDKDFVIPVLKEALVINPSLTILASPWSSPAWMKMSHKLFGGDFNNGQQYMNAYALYFVKFIEAYQTEGIHIDAITIQNEPLLSRDDYPTMNMNLDVTKAFIRDHIGPMFRKRNINTKILVWDFNWSGAWFPEALVNDGAVKQYIGGVAWHGYDGRHDAPDAFHTKHPDVALLTSFTRLIFIGQTKSWSKNVLLWNLALDEHNGPHYHVGGCGNCRGVITVPSGGGYSKNVEYYAMGHMSRFVKPGAVRLETNNFGWDELQAVAFVNLDGTTVIVVQNPNTSRPASFSLDIDAKHYQYNNLPPQSVVTFVK
ncbi:uncharacterized protein LOC127862039 isoform X2 [Dreissena polymorpha]|uniref:uncharacterized protein LOC127862039 isoform X2 n=1 Tax=Dreissena polymorpha TaxID=45954 RepID=UPI002264E9E2|nr:uncharacterized protein LOC127862039 isoform X2 [Dreissena polymorpha]